MTEALTNTDLQGALPLVARGKVRDLYEVDNKTLLFVATDRISAYDVIMENVCHSEFTNQETDPLIAVVHTGHPEQGRPSDPLHQDMVQDPDGFCAWFAHSLPHSRPPTPDPRVAATSTPEPKHASAQAADSPY